MIRNKEYSKKSNISHAVLDLKSRRKKASAIIEILKIYKDIKNSKALDIGTGSGIIAHEIGKRSKNVYSVDIRDERIEKRNFKFKKIKNKKLPFRDKEFDIVISNHVMAHVKDGEFHLKEINRVLKDGGVAYLSMLNRLCIIEPNFGLPFLSWLPKKLADSYVRLAGRGKSYDVSPLTYNNFTKKISGHFAYEDVTIKIISKKFLMPKSIYKFFKIFSPVWIFILRKKLRKNQFLEN